MTPAASPTGQKKHLARALWIVNICVIGAFAFLAASRMWRGAGFGDFHVFHDAFRAVLAGEDLYDSGIGGYIYPPLFAVVFAPLVTHDPSKLAVAFVAGVGFELVVKRAAKLQMWTPPVAHGAGTEQGTEDHVLEFLRL